MKNNTPGWDAQVISEIAQRQFGGYAKMFEHHNWPERGSKMIPTVQTRIAETYGSVKAFENHYAQKP